MRTDKMWATFEGWKLPNGRVLKTQFKVRIELRPARGAYRYIPLLEPTLEKFGEDWAESNLEGCKRAVAAHFERQVTDWK